MFPLFRFSRRAALIISPLSLFAMARPLAAQPDDTPRTIKSPQNSPVRAPIVVPEPLLLTPAEVQALTGGPTLITFSGQDVPVKEVVQALLDAAKIPPPRLKIPTDRLKPLTVDWKDVPFWSAASEVEKRSGGRWDTRYGGLSLVPTSRGPVVNVANNIMRLDTGGPIFDGRMAAQTPFVTLVANSLSRTSTRITRLGDPELPLPAVPDRTQLAMTAYFDPKLKVRSVALRDLKFQERENAPVINGRPNSNYFRIGPGSESNLISLQTVQIPAEITAGTTLTRLSGVLHSVVVAASQTLNVPDLAAATKTTRTIGPNQYTLESAEVRDNQLTLRLSAQLRAEPQAIFSAFETVRVRDAQGRDLAGGLTRIEGQKAEFNFRPDQAFQGPYSLEWVIVTEVRSLDVPFELRDVPVP